MSSNYNGQQTLGAGPLVYGASGTGMTPQPLGRLAWGTTVVLFCVLVGLAIPLIWFGYSAWQVRLTGTEAQATASIVQDCGEDDDGVSTAETALLFRDAQQQLHEIPPNNTCTNFYNDGDQVTIWYLPNDPNTTFVGGLDAAFLYGATALWAIGTLVCLWFFLRLAFKLVRAASQSGQFLALWRPALVALVILAPVLVAVKLFPPGGGFSGSTRNYRVGEQVPVEGLWVVTLTDAHQARVGLNSRPKDGDICLELDVRVRNSSNQRRSFDLDQFTLYTSQEKQVSTTCSLESNELQNTELASGQATSGAIVYEVPISQRQFFLAFEADPDGDLAVARPFWSISPP